MPQRGFTIRDLCFGLACLAIALALLMAASGQLRKRSQSTTAQNQLRWIAGVTASYVADYQDSLWGLSWRAGETYPFQGGTTVPSTGMIAAAYQAIDILNRRGRPDINPPGSWYPAPLYSHLPLLDYLDRDPPDRSFVSPGDKHRFNWTKDPERLHDQGFWLPYQESPGATNKRWPYSSSFHVPPAIVTSPYSGSGAVTQGFTHRSWNVPSTVELRPILLSDVVYPAQKVHIHESHSWYHGPQVDSYAYPRARVHVLSADGTAQSLAARDANLGWQPTRPDTAAATIFQYSPSLWEGPPVPDSLMEARYRFTRGGPTGRDFGGPEVDTGQP
ncbi:MAG: hypothetical protein ACF8R7_02440 [Phycisphaerales bacterium JB039]